MSERGSALVTGLMLLSLVMLLALSGAGAAHVELRLAHNDQFRENAAAAASAGIESALSRIVSTSDPDTVPTSLAADLSASLPGRFEVQLQFLGFELGIPQSPGNNLAAAHFEIRSTGRAARGAVDAQRAWVLHMVPVPFAAAGTSCEPAAPGEPCARAGDWRRVAWQRIPVP